MKLARRLHFALLKWLAKSFASGTDQRKAKLLRALGHDPAKHSAKPVTEGPWPGVRVVDENQRPVAFYTAKALKRLGRDPAFLVRWSDQG